MSLLAPEALVAAVSGLLRHMKKLYDMQRRIRAGAGESGTGAEVDVAPQVVDGTCDAGWHS